ncbi:hypothetical protein [Actinoplanes sp. NPDC051851]|uniref:hypothetical protein n=1 Tax=Actinoplanes sp. NPDC051851 TaxID=3154753 RepID=UPI0034371C76
MVRGSVTPVNRARTPTGFDLYYRRLAALSGNWVECNTITLDFSAFGGVTAVTVSARLPAVAPVPRNTAICSLATNWQYGDPFVVRDGRSTGDLDVRAIGHSANVSEVFVRRSEAGITVLFSATEPLDAATVITIELEITNLLLPLSERSPVNRSVCPLRITWAEGFSDVPARIHIHRVPGGMTCFTKGNFALAFPSRPAIGGLRTVLLYGAHRRLDLLYGFIRDPSTVLLRSASNLVFAGLGFLAAWLMAEVIISGSRAELAQYLAMLVGLTIPAVTAFAELVVLDRHTLYSRRRDLGFAITLTAIIAGALGTAGAVYLSVISDFGTRRIDGAAAMLPAAFLGAGATLVLSGTILLIGYRSGVVIPYVCDDQRCDRRLYLRHRHQDCYTTGRVVCRRCAMRMCLPCPRNQWQRGVRVLDDPGAARSDRWQYRCLPGSRE